jgi:hypothetical protein
MEQDESKSINFQSNNLETTSLRFCQSYISTVSKIHNFLKLSASENASALPATFLDISKKFQSLDIEKLIENCNKYYYYCLGSLLILVEKINKLIQENAIRIDYTNNNKTVSMNIFREDFVLSNLSLAFPNLVVYNNLKNVLPDSVDAIIKIDDNTFRSNIDYDLALNHCKTDIQIKDYSSTSYFFSTLETKTLIRQKMQWFMIEECSSVLFTDINYEEMSHASVSSSNQNITTESKKLNHNNY